MKMKRKTWKLDSADNRRRHSQVVYKLSASAFIGKYVSWIGWNLHTA